MKRVLIVLLTLVMLVTLTSCKDGKQNDKSISYEEAIDEQLTFICDNNSTCNSLDMLPKDLIQAIIESKNARGEELDTAEIIEVENDKYRGQLTNQLKDMESTELNGEPFGELVYTSFKVNEVEAHSDQYVEDFIEYYKIILDVELNIEEIKSVNITVFANAVEYDQEVTILNATYEVFKIDGDWYIDPLDTWWVDNYVGKIISDLEEYDYIYPVENN